MSRIGRSHLRRRAEALERLLVDILEMRIAARFVSKYFRLSVEVRQPMNKHEAQVRADRVRAFQEELDAVEREGVLTLSAEQRAPLLAHHGRLLDEMAEAFDIDVTGQQKQLSWG
jgi:hypothetical protein